MACQDVDPCCEGALFVTAPPPAPPHANAAGWVFAAVLVAVLVYEVWAVKTHHQPISEWMRHTFGRHRWWRPFAVALIGLTLWHLFLGGPL